MNPRTRRFVTLSTVAALLWIASLVPWPGVLGYLEPAKPTLIAIAFALTVHRLGVASWPLVVAFSLTFFIFSTAMFYFSPDLRGADVSDRSDNNRVLLTCFGTVLFSPITLWGPLLFGCGAYAIALRLWSNRRSVSPGPSAPQSYR
jgi:hypothetical protein